MYQVLIKDHLGNFIEDQTVCDGTAPTVVTGTQCLVPMSALWVAPFQHGQGAEVLAQVRAHNARGWSTISPTTTSPGGALVETVPQALSAPTRGLATTDSVLQSDWLAPVGAAATGGSAIVGYALYWDDATSSPGPPVWTELVGASATHTALTYSRTTGIVGGETYAVYVAARNKWGWGPDSPIASILAATTPGAPGIPVTAIDVASGAVTITWTAPTATGGVTTDSYVIEILGGDALTWRQDAACDGTNSGIVAALTCTVPMTSLVATAVASDHALAFDSLVLVRVSGVNVRG